MHGRGIRTARAYRGLTARAVAEAAGMSIWRLSRIERGRVAPREQELRRLAEVLDVDAKALCRLHLPSLDRWRRVATEPEVDRN